MTVLIIGGAGKTGRRVAERLAARGVEHRFASRSSERPFDWERPETWVPALRGATSIYLAYYPDLASPGAAERIGALCQLASNQQPNPHLVLLGGRGEPEVWASERAVRASGCSFTLLRCAWFNQNFSEGHLFEPLQAGELAFPAAATLEPFVDCEDIADVAVAALTDPARHAGQIYDLTGPRLLGFAEAVAEIARVSPALRYKPTSLEAYAELLAPHLPPEQARFFVELFGQLLDGHNALLGDGVQRALGRAPRDFSDYAQREAPAWSVA